jgi:hypothetical protein
MSNTVEQARAAKEKAKQLFTDNVGVGITRVGGDYAVKVNLSDPMADPENAPTSIEGVPIQFEVVGRIRKQQS